MSTTGRQNRFLTALQGCAERTARGLIRRPDVKVVVGDASPRYNWKEKTIYLPSFVEEPEDPRLADAFRGLVDHECGHIEHTDFDRLEGALKGWVRRFGEKDAKRMQSLQNGLEDTWMEAAWCRHYPGSEAHLKATGGYYHEKTGGALVTDPAFIPPGGKKPVGPFVSFTQAIRRVASGNMTLSEVHPDTLKLIKACEAEVEVGWAVASTLEACHAAEALFLALDKIANEEEEPPPAGLEGEDAMKDAEDRSDREALRRLAKAAREDESEELPDAGKVIAGDYAGALKVFYTVHPDSAKHDAVVTYGSKERAEGKDRMAMLARHSGPAGQKLAGLLSRSIMAASRARVQGGREAGEELDEEMYPDIARRSHGPGIWVETVKALGKKTGVIVLCDCSGSTGGHGTPPRLSCSDHIAVTAMTMHRGLQAARVQHAVLGYTSTRPLRLDLANPRREGGHLAWSRSSHGHEGRVFVPAPGLRDDGSALAFIKGHHQNFDGESLLWASQYAARAMGDSCDRLAVFMISDGLPCGADDCTVDGPYLEFCVDFVACAMIEVYGIGVGIGDWEQFAKFYPNAPYSKTRASTGHLRIDAADGMTDPILRGMTDLLTMGYGRTRR